MTRKEEKTGWCDGIKLWIREVKGLDTTRKRNKKDLWTLIPLCSLSHTQPLSMLFFLPECSSP